MMKKLCELLNKLIQFINMVPKMNAAATEPTHEMSFLIIVAGLWNVTKSIS